MATVIQPDLEQIVGGYLRGHSAVSALTTRVVARTPSDTGPAWVKYGLLGERPARGSSVLHLVGYVMQFDCYAGRTRNEREAAFRLAATVKAALADLVGLYGDVSNGPAVITGVPADRLSSSRIQDDSLDPALERYIVTATVYAHAAL